MEATFAAPAVVFEAALAVELEVSEVVDGADVIETLDPLAKLIEVVVEPLELVVLVLEAPLVVASSALNNACISPPPPP